MFPSIWVNFYHFWFSLSLFHQCKHTFPFFFFFPTSFEKWRSYREWRLWQSKEWHGIFKQYRSFCSKGNTFRTGQKLNACWLFTHCTHLGFFQPYTSISFYLMLIFWQMAQCCLWGLVKYVIKKADSEFFNMLILSKLYRQHNKNSKEGGKVEKSSTRRSDLKLLTSEPEESSDRWPLFF